MKKTKTTIGDPVNNPIYYGDPIDNSTSTLEPGTWTFKESHSLMDVGWLAKVFSLQAKIEALKTFVDGMKAENDQRIQLGQSIAYTEDSFSKIAEEMNEISKELEKQ